MHLLIKDKLDDSVESDKSLVQGLSTRKLNIEQLYELIIRIELRRRGTSRYYIGHHH